MFATGIDAAITPLTTAITFSIILVAIYMLGLFRSGVTTGVTTHLPNPRVYPRSLAISGGALVMGLCQAAMIEWRVGQITSDIATAGDLSTTAALSFAMMLGFAGIGLGLAGTVIAVVNSLRKPATADC